MTDPRVAKLADLLVNYSVELKRIVHEQIGELGHARIGHVGFYIASGRR